MIKHWRWILKKQDTHNLTPPTSPPPTLLMNKLKQRIKQFWQMSSSEQWRTIPTPLQSNTTHHFLQFIIHSKEDRVELSWRHEQSDKRRSQYASSREGRNLIYNEWYDDEQKEKGGGRSLSDITNRNRREAWMFWRKWTMGSFHSEEEVVGIHRFYWLFIASSTIYWNPYYLYHYEPIPLCAYIIITHHTWIDTS